MFQEEYNAYRTLKKLFGPEIKDHMIVVFSGADSSGATIGALLCSFCVITSILTPFSFTGKYSQHSGWKQDGKEIAFVWVSCFVGISSTSAPDSICC